LPTDGGCDVHSDDPLVGGYLRSLSRVIGDRLPPGVKAARLREAEGHLRMAAVEIGAKEAVRQYGPARFVAGELVRAERGYVGARSGRLAWGVSILIGVTMALQMNRYDLGLSPFLANLLIWVPTLALLGFAVRVGQTRRWLTFSVIPSLVVAWIATLAFSAIFGPVMPRDLSTAGKYLNVLRKEEAVWKRWRATGEGPQNLVPTATGLNCAQEIPLLPFTVPTGFRYTYALVSPGLANGSDDWKDCGAGWAKEFPDRLSDAEQKVAWLRKTPIERFLDAFTSRRLVTELSFILADVSILAMLNAVVLAFALVSDRRPVQRA
jgi:hypothetical protein